MTEFDDNSRTALKWESAYEKRKQDCLVFLVLEGNFTPMQA